MAAGLGFKDFTTGEVLTAADVDGYLMQGVWVFASAAARDSAVTSPQEGNFAYLKDTNVTTYYTGSAWANLDTTGMTNPMTTTGDTIYSSSGSTPARLGIGTAGQVLQVNSGATAPEWATPAGGGATLLATLSLSGSSTASGTISSSYRQYQIYIKNGKFAAGVNNFELRLNGDTGSNYSYNTFLAKNTSELSSSYNVSATSIRLGQTETTLADSRMFAALIFINRPSDTDKVFINGQSTGFDGGNSFQNVFVGVYDNSAAITSVTLVASGSTFTGDAYIYGVN